MGGGGMAAICFFRLLFLQELMQQLRMIKMINPPTPAANPMTRLRLFSNQEPLPELFPPPPDPEPLPLPLPLPDDEEHWPFEQVLLPLPQGVPSRKFCCNAAQYDELDEVSHVKVQLPLRL